MRDCLNLQVLLILQSQIHTLTNVKSHFVTFHSGNQIDYILDNFLFYFFIFFDELKMRR